LASTLHVSSKGNIKVSDQLGVVLVAGAVGATMSVPLLWLSWKIPQHILAQEDEPLRLIRTDPAIQALQWQDAVFVVLLCLSAVVAASIWRGEPEAVAAFGYCAVLLLLARIDARTHLLPDILTLPLLWAGLLWHATGLLGADSLAHAVWGAAAGYIALWLPACFFGKWLGKVLMGHGDFKFSAEIGAWLGCWSLPFVWLLASVASIVLIALATRFGGRRLREPMPFGPGLALGGILMLFVDAL
jgi:prepilin signal peptidase PulO-like enzyme (type II secretory pathway)